jgi:hypothetical protein
MSSIAFLICLVSFFILAAYALLKWFQIYNGPDGERYRRMLSQGAFAPLSKEDIAQDQQRMALRKVP